MLAMQLLMVEYFSNEKASNRLESTDAIKAKTVSRTIVGGNRHPLCSRIG